MKVLGISAYYHDSAAALLRDGVVVAAAQEERFTRKKHDSDFPHQAIRSCLESTGLRAADIDLVAFYDKPFLKFERLLETYLAFAPRGFTSFRSALPVWVKDKLFQKNQILKELKKNDTVRTSGGIFGKVVSIEPDQDLVVLEVDENRNVRLRVLRSSIAAVIGREKKDEAPAASTAGKSR